MTTKYITLRMASSFRLCLLCCGMAAALASCDDYLDAMPDNRTELNSEEKITQLLVSAYPTSTFAEMAELSSDNTDHIAGNWTTVGLIQDQAAQWTDITTTDDDSPYALWNASYEAIAAANAALAAIDDMGRPASLRAQRGEALLCRAYNHFVLATIFCRAYSPKTATTDLGIPYMRGLEDKVMPHYERSTVAEVYAQIEQDLLEGLPLIDDAIYSVPQFHFNLKAAQAFAARFYLYYVQPDGSNYDRVIQYATEVLTQRPATMLRDWATVGALSPSQGIRANGFVSADEKANLLLCVYNSQWARTHGSFQLGDKYCHGTLIALRETVNSPGIWGSNGNVFYYRIAQYVHTAKVVMDKFTEYFEYTDPVNHIGIPHVMMPAFTTDELLLNRAEAYAMKQNYRHALADLNTWVKAFTRRNEAVTEESVNTLYGQMKYYTPDNPTPKKQLHPDFSIASGTQENMLHAILHARRVLCLHEGLRWMDVKRYGIVIYRRTYNADGTVTVTDTLSTDDPRRALQLPQSVITAGLTANPR